MSEPDRPVMRATRRGAVFGIGASWAVAACSSALPPPPEIQRAAPAPFPLSRAANARHLVDAAGAPFMLHGDTAWSLIADLPREDVLRYLDDRASRGFNTILVSLLEHRFARHAPANYYRAPPFLTPNDYATPNDDYFAHADWVIAQAQERGLLVLLTPSYIGALGSPDEGWYAAMAENGEAKMRAYGRFLANRFRGRSNILWVHAGDDDPPDRSLVRAIALGIRETDPAPLHTIHARRDTNVLDYWPDESWLDVNTVYTRARIYDACARAYRSERALPFFFIEGTYESEHGGSEAQIRKEAFQSLLSGAFGYVFGNNPIWHFAGPGLYPAPYDWRGALSSRGAQSMTLVRQILMRANWAALEPDLDRRFLVQGLGAGEQRAVASVASDRRTAIVYMPSVRRIGLDLSQLSGTAVTLTWIDPSTGTSAPAGGVVDTQEGVTQFEPEEVNGAGFRDWVLLAESH